MKFHKDSWINRLVKEYGKLPADKIDRANELVLDTLWSLEKLNRGEKA